MEFFCAEVVPGANKYFKHSVSLGTLLQALFVQVPAEDPFCHTEQIVVCDRCVVDSFWEWAVQ